MLKSIIKDRDLSPEFTLTASRSSGPGGQHVNKVSTRVELRFNVMESSFLSDAEKDLIRKELANKINSHGELVLAAQNDRSQLKNKEKVIDKFYALLAKALTPVKKRRHTEPSQEAKEKRLEEKRINAQKKERRKSVE